MKTDTYYRKIARHTGVPLGDVKKVVREEAKIIQEVVATNNSVQLPWGTISGEDKTPYRTSSQFAKGSHAQYPRYTAWKHGVPHIEWAKHMMECETSPVEEYFDLPENRLTTEAVKYRRVMGIPDPPELQGKSDDERAQIMKEADQAKLDGMTGRAKKLAQSRMAQSYLTAPTKKKFWTSLGFMPIGILADKDYDGPIEDQVDRYIQATFNLAKTLPEKLDEVLYAQELAEYNGLTEKHPELFELEKKLRADMKKAGMRPLLHKKRRIIAKIGSFAGQVQELNKDGELIWKQIGDATREVNIQKLEEYKKFFEENGFTKAEIDRYVFRKQLRKRSDLEEIEEERRRLRLAQEGSLEAYDVDTVVDIRDKEDYLRKGLVGLDEQFNINDFIISEEQVIESKRAKEEAKLNKELDNKDS